MDKISLSYQFLSSLDERVIKQVRDQEAQLPRQASKAMAFLRELLKRHPGCLELREILRKAQEIAQGHPVLGPKMYLATVINSPLLLKLELKAKSDPSEALSVAEKILSKVVNLFHVHVRMGEIAMREKSWELAVFAYRYAVKLRPNNLACKLSLSRALLELGLPREAIGVADEVLKADKSSLEAESIIQMASVSDSLQEGNWQREGDFRDKLADETEAKQLEQAARVANDEAGIDELTASRLEVLKESPENLSLWMSIVKDYRRVGAFDKALQYLENASNTSAGSTDASLMRLKGEILIDQMDARIRRLGDQLKREPDKLSLKEDLRSLKAERDTLELNIFEDFVQKQPSDHAARFRLGEILFGRRGWDEAIRHFQIARQSPAYRTKSTLMMGRSFFAKGIYDMAVEQLEAVNEEMQLMDHDKKDVLYQLGLAYEALDKKDEAEKAYKTIYSHDIAYRDVAEKIKTLYR